MDAFTTVRPVQLRGRFFTAVALRVVGGVDEGFYAALDAQLQLAPSFLVDAPLVLDLEHAEGLTQESDVTALARRLRSRDLSVFGIQSGSRQQTEAARAAGLIALSGGRDVALDRAGKDRAKPREAEAEAAAPDPVPEPPVQMPAPAKIVTTPVRSGQTIFAESGDLVVVAPVGAGAELVAVGNIHVYGALRGRALAGVNGDETARIFCQGLEAELLAVAGLYRTSEDLDPGLRKARVQAFLQAEELHVDILK